MKFKIIYIIILNICKFALANPNKYGNEIKKEIDKDMYLTSIENHVTEHVQKNFIQNSKFPIDPIDMDNEHYNNYKSMIRNIIIKISDDIDKIEQFIMNHSNNCSIEYDNLIELENTLNQENPINLEIIDIKNRRNSIQFDSVLGRGGSKTFYNIGNGNAIAIPNLVNINEIKNKWCRIILDELKLSLYLQEIGIPIQSLSPFVISFEKSGNVYKIPTYGSKSFKSYSTNGAFIVDVKNLPEDGWPINFTLINNSEYLFDVALWKDILLSIKSEIKKLCLFGFKCNGDSCNLIIVKKNHQWHSGRDIDNEIHVFPFDLSSKSYEIKLPEIPLLNMEKYMLTTYLNWIVMLEFERHGVFKSLNEISLFVNEIINELNKI